MSLDLGRTPYAQFCSLYQNLGPDNVTKDMLAQVYADGVIFQDPMHEIHGLNKLSYYFISLYSNVISISFDFHKAEGNESSAMMYWTMTYRHPKLHKGKQDIRVEGVSLLQWKDGKIIRHQDIFDAGTMLYEHIPVLGWMIKKLKERLL